MPATYEPIATTTLGSTATSVTFSSISGSYTDLVLITNVACSTTNQEIYVKMNSDSGTNYSLIQFNGNGSTVGSLLRTSQAQGNICKVIGPVSAFETVTVTHFQNYSNSTTYKTWLSRAGRPGTTNAQGTEMLIGLWRSTSAITALEISISGGTFSSGSTFTLYGIKAA
jgi:hypothetical protein